MARLLGTLAKTAGGATVAGLAYLAVQPGGIASGVKVPEASLLEVFADSAAYSDTHEVAVPIAQVLKGTRASSSVTDDEVTVALARGLFASPVMRAELFVTRGTRNGDAWVATHRGSRSVSDFDSDKWKRTLALMPFEREDDVGGFKVNQTAPAEVLMRNHFGKADTFTWVSATVDHPGAVVRFRLGSVVAPAPGHKKSDLKLLPLSVPFHWVYSKFVLGFAVKEACAALSAPRAGS